MIDTDKYEGHSEMIDANEIGEIWEYLADTISEDSRGRAEANYNLVADAPLLLAEVKRLQKYEQEHKELWDIIADFSPKDCEDDNDTYQEWLESVSQGYMGSVYEYIMMKQEEMIE